MNKCDFCSYSKNINGKLVCPYMNCILSRSTIMAMLEKISESKFNG